LEAGDIHGNPAKDSNEGWADLTAQRGTTEITIPSEETPFASKPAFTDGHRSPTAGIKVPLEAGDIHGNPAKDSNEEWADLTAQRGTTKTTIASEETAAKGNPAFADGHEPLTAGIRFQFEAGEALELPVNGSDEGAADTPSTFDIESIASSDHPFTSSDQTGPESSSSDQHQERQDAQGFQSSQDAPSGAQPTETDPAFSLSQPARNVSSPAPVDERAAKVNVYQPDWTQRITEHLHESIIEGKNSLVVELEPGDLGQMTLRIEADQRQVTAWITTPSEETRNLLLQNTSALQKHLADHGLNLGQFNVNVGDERGNPRAYSGDRGGRKVSRTAGKTGSSVQGPAVLPGIHSRLRGDGSRQRISLIA
jgi:flagellar hook-length control protein FliK